MSLSIDKRNAIAWKYLLFQTRESPLRHTDFDSADTRQRIRKTAEKLDVPFDEAMAFVKLLLEAANK